MKLIHKYSTIIWSTLTIFVAIFAGLYVNLLTNELMLNDDSAPFAIVRKLKYWNILPILSILLVVIQYWLSSDQITQLKAKRDDLIQSILAAASKSLVFPIESRHVRSSVSLCDAQHKKRHRIYGYNNEADREFVSSFPVEFGVTGKAYCTKAVVAEELPENHIDDYTDEIKNNVSPLVRSILAAPLLWPDNVNDKPMGILTFDSFQTMDKVKFDQNRARSLAKSWADIIALILSVTGKTNV